MKSTLLAATLLLVPAAWAQSIAGLWDAKLDLNGTQIPFRMGFSGAGSDVKGWLFNGDDKEISNAGKLQDGAISLNFDSYAGQLKGTFHEDAFDGEYLQRGKRFGTIHATRGVARPLVSGNPELYKYVEVRSRKLLIRLEDFEQRLFVEDRDLVAAPKARVQEIHDFWFDEIMRRKEWAIMHLTTP